MSTKQTAALLFVTGWITSFFAYWISNPNFYVFERSENWIPVFILGPMVGGFSAALFLIAETK